MKTVLTFLKNHWKRMATLFVLSAISTFAAFQVHKSGFEVGKHVGRCEITCAIFMGDFIAYDDLTEDDVLGWIWEQNKQGDETADEYKTRIEADRTAYVQSKIDRNATQATGVHW